ncbi:beta-lactamase family protein [Acidobacteriia bacterium AH_259_A11_L15]|nr:beta-lactamase family protein [Acidobacteriia bacterium AH_259_A11_L15]
MMRGKRLVIVLLAAGAVLFSGGALLAQEAGGDGAAAQADSASLAAQTDQVFAQWDKPDSPGCVCAVMRDGEVVYSRAFGMANLELDVPLTPQSVFYIGGIAKQFTAASIALLALRGQLSLDDDIRTYVPELADFSETITIRHLVHHTSGLRNLWDLERLSGRTGRDYDSNARVLAVLSRQRTLNFRPGENYLYSNSAYIVLAEIVERVSGTSLREFAAENIFGPLGMANTQFGDDSRTIVKHRVQSYGPRAQGGLQRYVNYHDDVGAGGLLSTVEDLLRWDRNFDAMTVGGSDFIELLLTRGTLNSGDTLNYAFGFWHREYRGLKTVYHSGGWRGFRGRLVRFPEQRVSVAVLCNSTTINVYNHTVRVADIYLRDVFDAAATEGESLPAPQAVSVSTGELETVTGRYLRTVRGRLWAWGEDDYLARRIYVKDDTLSYFRASGSHEHKLAPLGNDRFYMLGTSRAEVIVSFTPPTLGQPRQMIVVEDGGAPSVFDAVEPVSPSPAELEGYLGTYFSEELDYEWVLRITHDGLSMWDPRTWHEFALAPFTRDVFSSHGWWGFYTFSRDGQGRVVGFTVDTPGLRNLKFVRR